MEPSRCQMVFPLRAPALSSFIVYVDVVERKMVYMDAALKCNVARCLEQRRDPVRADARLCRVSELAAHGARPAARCAQGQDAGVFSDRDLCFWIEAERAFVFRPENPENTLERVSIADLLEA
jgi:hypothetical protein